MHTTTPGRLPLVALALISALRSPARAADDDRWYELWLAGSRAGWIHESVSTEGERITTRSGMRMVIGRADTPLEITTETEFVESTRGEPIEVRVEQRQGDAPITTTYEFTEDGVLVRSSQAGVSREWTMAEPPGEWLPPAAAAALLRQRLSSGAEEVVITTVDPSTELQVVTVSREDIEAAEVEWAGATVEGFTASATTRIGSITVPAKEWFDAEGVLLRSETSIGGMQMMQVASTREKALAAVTPPELMVSTFVKPDRPIPSPRTRERAVYTVSVGQGELPEIPGSAYQTAEPAGEAGVRVTVDLAAAHSAGEIDRDAHLAATTYANTEDRAIIELVTRALADAPSSPRERAEALRRFVFRHIRDKSLGQAFATASDTARSRAGDCSEHGVLLAAMLRGAGIPSRVAAGVVYVDEFAGERGVFGYHMWAQALVETDSGPAWIDLDATLDDRAAFDATHIAFAVSDLAEGAAITSLAGIAPLLGTLEIKVEEVR